MTMRLAAVLIAAGMAIGAIPAIVGVARSKALSMAATALALGGVIGLAANVAGRLRPPQRPENNSTSPHTSVNNL